MEQMADISGHFEGLGYHIIINNEARKAAILTELKDPNTAVWAFIGHGDGGWLVAYDEHYVVPKTAVLQRPFHLAEVILFACNTKKEKAWRQLISQYGKIHWTTEAFYTCFTDWEDLPYDVGRGD